MAIIIKDLATARSAILALIALTLYAILRRIYIRYRHLQQIPGPKWAAYTRWWLLRTYASGDSANTFLNANKKYGKLARIGPNHLLTDDPEINWRILGPHSKYRRGNWFDSLRFDPCHTSIASETDPVKHDVLRWKLSAGYATKDFPDLEAVVDKRISVWIHSVHESTVVDRSKAKVFDLARSVRFMTLDTAGYICFSQGLGVGDHEGERNEFWASIEESAPFAQYLSTIHGLFSIIHILSSIPGVKRRLILTEDNNPGIGRIMRISRIVTEKRFGSDAKPVNDMLGSWIRRGLTQHEAKTETSIALVTGAFPTASAVNVILLHIATNPRILAKIRYEYDTAVSEGLISSPVRNSEAMKLPYFQACVDEAFRRFPPITQLRERVTPPGGDIIDGHHIPGGTNIGLNAWGLQRHICFGNDPEVFRPERWLEAGQERLTEMKKVQGLIFGYGGTKCLGITQASMIINKSVIEVLRRFDIEVANPTRPWIDQCNGVSFHREFFVCLGERTKAQKLGTD